MELPGCQRDRTHGCSEEDMEMVGATVEEAGDRVRWRLMIRCEEEEKSFAMSTKCVHHIQVPCVMVTDGFRCYGEK